MVLGAMQHPVLLTRGYWLADSACTQALWQSVTRQNPSRFADDDQGPVEQVSWDDVCNDFLPKLAHTDPGLALRPPTEAEWEFAARCAGQAMRSFGWGEGITTDHANYDGNNPLRKGDKKGEYRKRTMPVKSFKPNAPGRWQMHGNVWEWTADLMAEYPSTEVVDPGGRSDSEGPRESAYRVLRGGSWIYDARYCRSADRFAYEPGYRYGSFGFRLARGLPEAQAEPAGVEGVLEARRPGDGTPGPAARQRGQNFSADDVRTKGKR